MRKCLKIMFAAAVPDGFLQKTIQKQARKLEIEGTAQVVASEGKIRIIVCGQMESIDALLDVIHKEVHKIGVQDVEVEPFLKDKNYRGVFRVIE